MWRTSPSTSVLLSLKTGYEERIEEYLNSFIDVTISPDGKYLSTCSIDDGCYFYKVVCKKGKCSLREQNLKLGKEQNKKLSVFISQIFYPQKDTLIVRVVSPAGESYYKEVKLTGGRSIVVKSLRTLIDILDACGNWILLSFKQAFFLKPPGLMDLKTRKMYKLPYDGEDSVLYCTLLNNGNFLACILSNDEKEYLKIWNISDPLHFREVWEDKNQIREIRFSPDRKVVLLADYTNRELKILRIHNSIVKLLYRIPFNKVIEALENGERETRKKEAIK